MVYYLLVTLMAPIPWCLCRIGMLFITGEDTYYCVWLRDKGIGTGPPSRYYDDDHALLPDADDLLVHTSTDL